MQNDNKSGHIKHEDIDMDTHDRAVRRNAGSHSAGQAKSSNAPLWLICILIFRLIIGTIGEQIKQLQFQVMQFSINS